LPGFRKKRSTKGGDQTNLVRLKMQPFAPENIRRDVTRNDYSSGGSRGGQPGLGCLSFRKSNVALRKNQKTRGRIRDEKTR